MLEYPVDSLALLSYLGSLTTFPDRERLVVELVYTLQFRMGSLLHTSWSQSGIEYLSHALLSVV